jgi:hypothetical protein
MPEPTRREPPAQDAFWISQSGQPYRVVTDEWGVVGVLAWHVDEGWFPSCLDVDDLPRWDMRLATEDEVLTAQALKAQLLGAVWDD